MGDYNSLRVDVGLEVEGVGDPNPTFEKAWKWVESKVIEKTNEIKESLEA